MDIKTYLEAFLNTMDSLSKEGYLHVTGVEGILRFSACLLVILNIIEHLNKEDKVE